MNDRIALTLALALLASAPAAAAPAPMTPMTPGFHQLLKCNGGYVTVDVAAPDPKVDAHADLVTTAVARGPALTKTQALRAADDQGNIYTYGYVLAPNVVKRFAKQLLLPAVPPPAGQHGTYSNIGGTPIDKHFEGTKPATDLRASGDGHAFSDYAGGHKLNTVIYVPAQGISELRFYGVLPNKGDLVCRPARK